jgi:hypothetical protein
MTPHGSLLEQSKARTKIIFKEGKASEYISYLRTTFRISASTTINATFVSYIGYCCYSDCC